MQQIGAGQFKARCLKLMDQVQQTHEEIVITKHGQPVAKLVPVDDDCKTSIVGYMKDTVQVTGDIISPVDEVWEADAE
ncbi:type II toxin-antitoxin system Phd/YefM family antitoxin [Acaryochloris sp. CCMEE 5410]|uniref:type II toxin-antitoxin system Phd/YefM family antitoxin n=1 Tax=Acaryochloris sp. CCMEE 5410 TaxID=310037 RepID=UPI0002484BAE|nr:type II toxin-antitoxin system Phd/YefM family antitoxin [Acaryochloris sp. CCMEE 5410]KAI9134169.1 type II toxin-antitoxin system Phd/YefM family antitoxin [Acaryochloris sp. CCMEE 5410]